MTAKLTKRVEGVARVRQARAVERIANQVQNSLPAVEVQTEEGRVVVHGRKLLNQWLSHADLRFIGARSK